MQPTFGTHWRQQTAQIGPPTLPLKGKAAASTKHKHSASPSTNTSGVLRPQVQHGSPHLHANVGKGGGSRAMTYGGTHGGVGPYGGAHGGAGHGSVAGRPCLARESA